MKTIKKKKKTEMRKEYDFSKAERGKFHRPLNKGYTVHVQKKDGTVEVKQYTLTEGTVLLAPDVQVLTVCRKYTGLLVLGTRILRLWHLPSGQSLFDSGVEAQG